MKDENGHIKQVMHRAMTDFPEIKDELLDIVANAQINEMDESDKNSIVYDHIMQNFENSRIDEDGLISIARRYLHDPKVKRLYEEIMEKAKKYT